MESHHRRLILLGIAGAPGSGGASSLDAIQRKPPYNNFYYSTVTLTLASGR